ncbi:MAG TPA: type VI secretion system tip protein TssI/VgrG [Candidatus Acidoferrum sp.]
MIHTQEKRLLRLETPLGDDVLLLQTLSGHEGISQPFHLTLDLLSENHSIVHKDIVGKQVTISVHHAGDDQRHWNGFVSRFACTGGDNRFSYYHAEIVPWLWFLTRTADCQIFQQKTIPEIIKKVFQDHGFQDFQDRTQATYPQREYVVQYRETAFNFVSRLMEEAGIFYFFEHDQSTHKLVFADKPQVHKNCPVQYKTRFNYTPGGTFLKEDLVESWGAEQELRPGKYALTDYNFQTPNTSLMANVQTVAEIGGNTKYEIYDYPGIHTKKSEGDDVTKIRMEEEEAVHHLVTGSSNCRSFASGYKFHLDEHPRKDQNGDYLLTEVTHSASVGESYSGSGNGGGETYTNHFTCIPAAVPFRPQRLTPKPVVQGLQTAVVVGPAGEEIYPDKYGRVKVQFFWDRLGKKNENSSCWVRVSQPWAGKNWGAMNIPRIGQEVIVDFLEGDPDRPIITGRVYNDEQMPPYALPDNMTRTTFMSRSTKGAGSANYNELRFEDKKGSEQIFLNAEKDMDHRVENQSREYIGNDRSLIVKANQRELVEADKHAHVKGTHFEKIDGDMSLQIGAKQMEKVGADKSTEVDGDHKEKIVGNVSLQVGQDQKEQVGGSVSLQVGQSRNEKVGMTHAMEAGQTIHLKGGMTVIIEAGMQLSLKAAGGFVDIGPAGVTIQGTMVLINSGGAAGSGPGASPQSPASPDAPNDPKDPDTADDGTKGGKLN